MSERYVIKGKIGQGGVGAVYHAFDSSLKRDVAIKRLLSETDKPEEERRTAEVLIKEAGMLSKLQHPNIVTVYDVGIDDDGGYVVMELIDGETFDLTVARGALTAGDFAQVVDQTLEAIIAAQEIGMMHRDIKPSNVMVTWLPSGRFQIKVLDFGLAKLSQTPALQTIDHGDSIMGSIYFMAPEQFDREPLDGRTDLYSLGCLYYYGLTGSYPFDGDSAPDVMMAHIEHRVIPLQQLRPDLPAEICAWVMRLISKEQDHRPATAVQALEDFKPCLAAIEGGQPPEAVLRQGALPAPSPNRPQLITGPVAQLSNQADQQLHTTTAYQLHRKKNAMSLFAITVWSLALLSFVAAGWLVFGKRGKDAEKPREKETTSREVDGGQTDPIEPDPEPPVEARPLPTRTDTKGGGAPQRFVFNSSRWKYNSAAVPAGRWFKEDFDDSKWPIGKSPLGFGDPVETDISVTEEGAEPPITYYFRKTVRVKNAPPRGDRGAFVAKIQYDDGFRMFLNGEEILRVGFETDKILPNTLAQDRGPKKEEDSIEQFVFDPDVLKDGKNVFAVEVHQSKKNSSDLRFMMIWDYVEKRPVESG